MPAGFDKCRADGGRIRTIKPTKDTYVAVCFIGGKSYRGEVHHVKKSSGSSTAEAIEMRMKGAAPDVVTGPPS